MSTNPQLEAFTHAYLTAALWSSTDDAGEPLDSNHDVDDVDAGTLAKMQADCATFYAANEAHIHCDGAPQSREDATASESEREAAMAGHDFWLTRCGHGAGFWDGDWPEPSASIMTRSAEAFGNVDLYVGDDGKVYA